MSPVRMLTGKPVSGSGTRERRAWHTMPAYPTTHSMRRSAARYALVPLPWVHTESASFRLSLPHFKREADLWGVILINGQLSPSWGRYARSQRTTLSNCPWWTVSVNSRVPVDIRRAGLRPKATRRPGAVWCSTPVFTRVGIAARKWKHSPVSSLKDAAPACFPIPRTPEPHVVVPVCWLVPVTVRDPDVPGVVVPGAATEYDCAPLL